MYGCFFHKKGDIKNDLFYAKGESKHVRVLVSTLSPSPFKPKKVRPPSRREKHNSHGYQVARFDEYGWADADKYKPIPYDMLHLKTDRNRVVKGWWAEFYYDGYRLRDDEKVLKWKKCYSQWGWDN